MPTALRLKTSIKSRSKLSSPRRSKPSNRNGDGDVGDKICRANSSKKLTDADFPRAFNKKSQPELSPRNRKRADDRIDYKDRKNISSSRMGKSRFTKRRDSERDESDEGYTKGSNWRRGKNSERNEGKGKKVRVLSKGEYENRALEKEVKANVEEKLDEVANRKPIRFQTRVLDKTGKKLRGHKKTSDEGSEELSSPPKKRKRIKLDRNDISNKRLEDGLVSNGNTDKAAENDAELSKNAQFRAIQPSPSILSFVEENLLGRRRLIELKNAGYNVKLSAPLDNIPFSTSTEREHIEENVFRNKLEFFAAAKVSSSFPPPTIPEIAFAGKSNVGKSSLLNALTRQWGVVRTSDKPGLTQTINFFRLASKLCLVDLPGYGFAYAKEEVKDAWEELVKEYVSTREGLKRVCLLIDAKWGMKPRDYELIELMERSRTPYQILLTKTDVVFPIDVARQAVQVQENLNSNKSIIKPVMMVSSKSGAGIRSLRSVLSKIARFAKP